jgi:hypothetical protein
MRVQSAPIASVGWTVRSAVACFNRLSRDTKPDEDSSGSRISSDARQLRFAIQFAQSGPYVLERLENTRLQVIGVKGIKEQQIADEWILPEPGDERLARRTGFEGELHHSFQSASVHFHQELNQLPGSNFRGAVGHLIELADESAKLANFLLKFPFVDHAPPS